MSKSVKQHWKQRYRRGPAVQNVCYCVSAETRVVSTEVLHMYRHLPGVAACNRTFDRMFMGLLLRERERLLKAYARRGLSVPEPCATNRRARADFEKWKSSVNQAQRGDGADREL